MMDEKLYLFLRESNAIEGEYSEEAFEDSIGAWQYAAKNSNDFDINYVCGIHKVLMGRLNLNNAGKLRRKTVYIVGRDSGGERRIIRTIPAGGNRPRLEGWCKRYKTPQSAEDIREAHIDFEMIHPFMDGNGRTGRILYNVQRLQIGLDIEVFYDKDKQKYYKWFEDRQRNDDMIETIRQMEELNSKNNFKSTELQ